MCQISILLIVAEIVRYLGQLMRINFIANDSIIDARLAALPLGDKIEVKPPLDTNPEQSRREANIFAQKVFMLICDLINLPFETPKDKEATQMAASAYIDLLSENVVSIPDFQKTAMDAHSDEMFRNAVSKTDELGWNIIKNNLIVCKSQIFYTDKEMEILSSRTDNKNNPYTYNFSSDWNTPSPDKQE